ncbi:DUF1772 domain-containing protein [Nonomuraea lactucae]|uniref:anthrone oxygenase family protein n=1 Tax=Nonomuraea lactucae TaxID=2249762 RepID=UPI001F05D149|nr:anthrone oxygenase family protein [Nonomuraea lactucae]
MLPVLAILALLLNGLMAGLFYTFSVIVMRSLDAIEPAQATATMSSVNVKILNAWFLPVFLLAPVASLVTGLLLLMRDGRATAGTLFLVAAAAYFLGVLGVTAVVNVPMNNALDSGALDWSGYSPRWTRWNHLRTVASVAALVLAAAGLYTA